MFLLCVVVIFVGGIGCNSKFLNAILSFCITTLLSFLDRHLRMLVDLSGFNAVVCRYITCLVPAQMGQMRTVKNLDGRDYRNLVLLTGGGSILARLMNTMVFKMMTCFLRI